MHKRELKVGERVLSIETGKLAKQANGSALVRYGDTVVLVTACSAAAERQGIDFLPLTVDYREYTYASGRIPGGFFKREGKPTEKEVLDQPPDRPARPAPLFPPGWRHESQIIALVLSADSDNDSDVLSLVGRVGRAGALGDPGPQDARRRPRRPGRLRVHPHPTYDERNEPAWTSSWRDARGTRDGRGRRPGGLGGGTRAALRDGARGHPGDRRGDRTDWARERASPSYRLPTREHRPHFYREVEERVFLPLSEAMRNPGQAGELQRVDQLLED